MKHRVYFLEHDQPRCRPSEHCDRQETCLRYKAPMQPKPVVINGTSGRTTMMGIEMGCAWWLRIPHDESVP